MEKHPETHHLSEEDPGSVTAPWDDPDTKAAWDQHAAEMYYTYWEQYSYWAAQGWTTDHSICEDTGLMNGSTEGQRRGQTEETGQQGGEQSFQDVDTLSDVLEQNCSVKSDRSPEMDQIDGQTGGVSDIKEVCGSDDPSDGGDNRKRAASSSKTAGQKGNN